MFSSDRRLRSSVMNLIVITLMALALTSCYQNVKIIETIPEEKHVSMIDFTLLTEKGFLITPEPILEPFESIGPMYYKFIPTSNRKLSCLSYQPTEEERKRGITAESTNSSSQTRAIWEPDEINFQELIEEVYQKATAMGGDAIMNYKMSSCSEVAYVNRVEVVHRVGVIIEGFVVKRTRP